MMTDLHLSTIECAETMSSCGDDDDPSKHLYLAVVLVFFRWRGFDSGDGCDLHFFAYYSPLTF
jgi:hypothetical protein